MYFRLNAISAAAAAAFLALAAPAGAVTVDEVGNGQFSKHYNKPTELGAGIDGISGTGWQNQFDIVHFTGLNPGAQTITIDFWADEGVGYSYQSDGVVKYSTDPFAWEWAGTEAGRYDVRYDKTKSSVSFDLGAPFGGELYLALYFTGQNKVNYGMYSSNPLPIAGAAPEQMPAVPLPAGFVLLGSALAGGGLLAAARRRKSAPAA